MRKLNIEQWQFIRENYIKNKISYKVLAEMWKEKYPETGCPKAETVSRHISAFKQGLNDTTDSLQSFRDGLEYNENMKQKHKDMKEIAKLQLLTKMAEKIKLKHTLIKNTKHTLIKDNNYEIEQFVLFGDIQETGDNNVVNLFNYLYEKIIKTIKKKKIIIVDVGDPVEGFLRTSSLITSKGKDFLDQTNNYSNALIHNLLDPLLKQGYLIDFITVNSNHGQIRMMGLTRNELESLDVLKIIKNNLDVYYKGNNSINIICNQQVYYYLFKHSTTRRLTVLIEHGQHLRMNTKGYLDKFVAENNKKPIDFLIHGHHHKWGITDVGNHKRIISVPAMQESMIDKKHIFKFVYKPGFMFVKINKDGVLEEIQNFNFTNNGVWDI